jgi:hypothetical protein
VKVPSPVGDLERLRDLRDAGAISEEDFERGKEMVLA